MPVEVSTHPDFLARQAKYNAERRAAEAAGDEAAQERAKAEWQAAMNQMQVDLYERQNGERDRQARIAQIRAENPAAPDEIFAGGDLAQMEAAAKAVQAVANQHQNRGGAGSWSPPPSGTQTAGTEVRPEDMTPEEREAARVRRMDEIAPKVMQGGALARAENKELQELSLRPLTERFQRRDQSR